MDGRARRGAPLPPRPKRATCADGAQASDSCTGTARRGRSRAGADPSSQAVAVAIIRPEGCTDRSGSGSTHSGDDQVLEASYELGRELSPIFTPSLEEGEPEEAFPALPHSTGHRESSGRPPTPSGSTTGLDRPDYSTLAERLAAEAAAAAAAETSSPRAEGRSAGGSLSRLSVLPGFGDGRRSDQRLRGSNSDAHPGMDDSPMSELSSKKLSGAEEKHGDGPLAQSLPPTSRSNVADHMAGTKRRTAAVAETAALRARLRERWFRLEAARKAQRQRESAERGTMAAEDANVNGGDGVCADPSGDVDDSESSGGDRDSSGDRGAVSSSSEPHDRPPQDPGGSLCVATANEAHSIADVSTAESRAVPASGVAAMRRAEAAAASSAATPTTGSTALSGPSEAGVVNQCLPQATLLPENTNASVIATGLDDARELRDEGGDGGVVHPEERVHAACEAGKAGVLIDLLVRSGGRAADGKDKVRGQRKQVALHARTLLSSNS